ncbi:uncharacterized protein L969DRAFT_86792 [Mixia osmundae IAM 14324]|uniref:PCI domain-containing protein n=1 Tax=Mixia osmundae (strain CBS 9802 / IAM 14324 / JCM 22182 / KY 12970) TaxID=764103 RepID=G7E8R2_MIXOS|nr:uncharacterized protein L969DRAFT_86792 [Mixia osmundae IAM 14324]KEI40166.1 hypothetical protein L969DRAFT_86792 [Mixia osmundae IAM 14324]GAA99530.1 hypothetical protein E5Q_06231 [Mixia osmundae IAM 14324]
MASTSQTSKPAADGGDPDSGLPAVPDLALAQATFVLSQAHLHSIHGEALRTLTEGIKLHAMGPYLSQLLGESSESSSSSTTPAPISLPAYASQLRQAVSLEEVQKANKEEREKLQAKVDEALVPGAELEVVDALKAKALYLAQIGNKTEANEAYEAAYAKTAGIGSKIDMRLAMIRLGFFHSDHKIIKANIDKAKALVDEGGDWDRRNRLKAYEGTHLLMLRDFKTGGQLLIDTLSTFGAVELMSLDDFVRLCIIVGVLTLDRKDLKKKIIDAPEVIQVLPESPHLRYLASSLHDCDYAQFFQSLADVEQHHLKTSRILYLHTRYYVRELRLKAYAQLLESYRSVTLQNLSKAFNLSEDFLDADLARYIAAGRLRASIDKVNGVVETTRSDTKNAHYEAALKQGDSLLNGLQKLSRVLG